MPRLLCPLIVACVCGWSVAVPASAVNRPTVDLEVVTEAGAPITAAHDWLDVLKDVGFENVSIRSARPDDREAITRRGTGALLTYRVIGFVTRRNSLDLAGDTFTLRDKRGLQRWLKKLRLEGEGGLRARQAAFGLSPRQLVQVKKMLARQVRFSTKNQPTAKIVHKIGDSVHFDLQMDPTSRKVLATPLPVADEFSDLSSGTALAAVLRPLGLVLVPRKQSNDSVTLLIADMRKSSESWPVGWASKKKAAQVLPKLMDFLTVEIQNQPLIDVLNALASRLDTPLLLDHNSLALHRIEPSQVLVTVPSGRTYYKRVLDRVLIQSMLKSEIRVDEAGKPFFWISSARQ